MPLAYLIRMATSFYETPTFMLLYRFLKPVCVISMGPLLVKAIMYCAERYMFRNVKKPSTIAWSISKDTDTLVLPPRPTGEYNLVRLFLLWTHHTDFVQDLVAKTRPSELLKATTGHQQTLVSLEFTDWALEQFMAMSARSAQKKLQEWRVTNIFDVNLRSVTLDGEAELDRWRLLFRTLGTISTLKIFRLVCSRCDTRSVIIALGQLRQIVHLSLFARAWQVEPNAAEHMEDFAKMAQALQEHPCLESLEYGFVSRSYRLIMPALQRIKSLSKISVFPVDQMSDELAVEDAQALAEYVSGRHFDKLRLGSLQISSIRSCQYFCDGIANSRAVSIRLANLLVQDPALLAKSLAQSSYATEIELSFWRKTHNADLTIFLSALAENLPNMKVEKLDMGALGQLQGVTAYDFSEHVTANQSVLPLLVRAAARCHSLVELKLPFVPYSDALDEALSILVQSKDSRLQTLVLGCSVCRPEGCPPVKCPLFREAIKSNMNITSVQFKFRQCLPSGESLGVVADPWCDDLKRDVAMISRLNQCGRAKVQQQARNDHARALQLLEKVNGDADCLYFHLRENPAVSLKHKTS